MTVDDLTVDEMTVDDLTVDEMAVDDLTCYRILNALSTYSIVIIREE